MRTFVRTVLNTKPLFALFVATAFGFFAGCSTPATPKAVDRGSNFVEDGKLVDISVLTPPGTSGNAPIFASPVEMASVMSVAVVGTVKKISDGYELLQRGTEAEGYDIRDRTAVLEISVSKMFKGSTKELDPTGSGSIYIVVSRGAAQEGIPDEDGGPSTITPLTALDEAIPVGSEVIAIVDPDRVPEDDPSIEVIDRQRGAAEGAVLLAGGHPQALTFADATDGYSPWPDRTYDQVLMELEKRF